MIIKKNLNIKSKHCLTIIKILKSSNANTRIIGGAVRDSLLGVNSSDIDIATDLTPDKVIKLLSSHNIKVIPTGIKFGTVTAIIQNEHFEITTLRKDLNCDGRYAQITYTDDFAEDAARRDFTINALSYCPIEHIIYDYFDGISDLKAKKLIFIGNPEQRIKEDYLRILRFFRFSSRYAKELNKEALEACILYKKKLKSLSGERIKAELDLLLPLPNSSKILSCMFKIGILEQILPIDNYDQELHKKALKIANSFGTNLELPIIYTILFISCDDISLKQLLNLKFSRLKSRMIIKMLELTKTKDISIMITKLKNIWLENKDCLLYFICASLTIEDFSLIKSLHNDLKKLNRPVFPVNGEDLLKLGYKNKELGKSLNFIKNAWIESNFTLNKIQLIKLVKNSE